MMTLCMLSILGFYQANIGIGIIAGIALFVFSFQVSVGPIVFNHIVETCLPATIGPANGFIWIWCITSNSLGAYLMDKIGPPGTFLFFGGICFASILYSMIFVRNTTYRFEGADITKVAPDSNLEAKQPGK